jgi:hypothetical protein
MSSLCTDILLPKKSQSQTVIREKLRKAIFHTKGLSKMLMKLIPGSVDGQEDNCEEGPDGGHEPGSEGPRAVRVDRDLNSF